MGGGQPPSLEESPDLQPCLQDLPEFCREVVNRAEHHPTAPGTGGGAVLDAELGGFPLPFPMPMAPATT